MIPRDRKHTIFQLEEAVEELRRIIKKLRTSRTYGGVDFETHIAHAYHHLNYAWNTRRLGGKRAWAAKDKDFKRLGRMPKDLKS